MTATPSPAELEAALRALRAAIGHTGPSATLRARVLAAASAAKLHELGEPGQCLPPAGLVVGL